FASRRRHTRCYRDWSSDVCSSDLFRTCAPDLIGVEHGHAYPTHLSERRNLMRYLAALIVLLLACGSSPLLAQSFDFSPFLTLYRSEERRVGTDDSVRWSSIEYRRV